MVSTLNNKLNNTPAQVEELQTRAFPVLKSAALVGLAGDVVRTAVRDSEADPAAVLFTFLSAIGIAFGASCFVPVGNTKHPPRLFTAIVGSSAKARKGTSAGPIQHLFENLKLHPNNKQPLRITPGPLASGEGIIFNVRDASDKIDKETGEPEDPGVTDKRLLIISPELDGALTVAAKDGNTLSAILRQSWDDGNLDPLTKHNRMKATGAHVGVVGHITTKQLLTSLKPSDISNGFANRFLWVCAQRKKQVPLPAGFTTEETTNLVHRMQGVLDAGATVGCVELSNMARAMWIELYPVISKDDPSVVGEVTARAEAQVLRLALVYALLDCKNTIEPEHLKAALAAWEYCRQSAHYLWGGIEPDSKGHALIAFLKSGRKSQTEINKHFSGHLAAGELRLLLEGYQATGRITRTQDGSGRGKPTTLWELTPGFESISADLADLAE